MKPASSTPYIAAVSGAAFRVLDLEKSVDFYTRIWGLELIEKNARSASFRAAGPCVPILTLTQGDAPAIDYLVMIAHNPEAVEKLAANLHERGYELLDPPGANYPEGRFGLACQDPDGTVIRVIGQPATTVAKPMPQQPTGISHIALNAGDQKAVVRFYCEGLGFHLTDSARMTGLDFLGCDHMHHRLAVMGGFEKPRINHVSFELPDLESFLRKVGQVVKDGVQIIGGPGRHDTGDNTFAYFPDPDERVIELSTGMEVILDRTNWTPRFWVSGLDQWGFGLSLRNEEMRKRTL